MFFVLPSAVYPRQTVERLFKALYQLGNVIHAMSFVVLMTEYYIRLQSSLPDYFTRSEVSLSPQLALVMNSCNYSGMLNVGGVRSKVEVTEGSLPAVLLYMTQYILAILVVEFLAIVNNALGIMGYSAGRRHLRVIGLHVPVYHVSATISILYCIALIVLSWVVYPTRTFYSDAVLYCVTTLGSENNTMLLMSEYDSLHLFDTPLEWAFAAAVVNLALYIAGIVVLSWHSCDSATVLLSASSVPWEKHGLMCTTDKAALRIHTTARETILKEAREALARGEKVRIVRSYALMTEADYEAQVEEMRRRFAERAKEEQYEQMCTYFERESDLDEGGLLWRRQVLQPPPPPPPPQRHYEQGQYELDEGPFIDGKHVGLSGDAFVDIFDNRDHEEQLWNQFGDDTYLMEADDGGELVGVSPNEKKKRHRHHKRRRHRHHEGEIDRSYHNKSNEDDEEENGAVFIDADALEEPEPYEIEADEGVGEAEIEDEIEEEEDDQTHRRHHRRRRHRHRRGSAEPNVELEGDYEMASPIEDADEL
ncbi:uncharacterized protein TM35_000371600 [Trypanosoma theileri]|uniref:Uncharacterized protein n=1 Tax=Trypanosoma theileri TaxID=67003 RepID=A0A1X0NKK8_9TRYP|nr:uncharacterized protein TM35_000371600 [Trypanosoma theileri]ORC85187.1 hypothetical protein TM35_000371600 [Trypanosoma theileri]